ncbi:superoxide dismutase family protein [Jejudonia soesokkakensis]|uniref:Superoxide dismutase [Cu-Zn] n=1 Tax=Jejudonia soesokkakensis TaxID=1323432 RepID=A0ABW2MY09_9FLAO
MKKLGILLLGIVFISFISCNETKKEETVEKTVEEIIDNKTVEVDETPIALGIELEGKSGSSSSARIKFLQEDGLVKMEARLNGLEPGTHAIHIHEKADCSADDATSSGGHWNPTFEPHGKWGDEEGYHRGDIGNFEVGEDGTGSISMQTDEWCLGCDDEKKNIIGKAIIVHQGADDFTSQPSGDAGARVSCGGIIQ